MEGKDAYWKYTADCKKFRFSRKLSLKHLTNGFNIRSGDSTMHEIERFKCLECLREERRKFQSEGGIEEFRKNTVPVGLH